MEKTLPSSNASNASNASSNFSNFRNYPNYFRFPIYKFILQKNIFYFWKKLYPLQTLQTLQTPLPTFPISATTLIIFGFLFINLFYKKIFSIFGKNFTLFKRFKRFKRLFQLFQFPQLP